MTTFVPAGRVVAVFVHDGQGRRVVLGEAKNRVIDKPFLVATHKGEARALIFMLGAELVNAALRGTDEDVEAVVVAVTGSPS